jgi:acyl carrier protein
MSDTYESLRTLLTEKFEVDAALIRPEASLEDLDLDSLAVVELFVLLQERWEVPLDEGGAVASLTVADTTALLDAGLFAAGRHDAR